MLLRGWCSPEESSGGAGGQVGLLTARLCLQGELNGLKGLVPSNFLEEVPEDVEVYLSDAPSPYAQDAPPRSKAKRVSRPHLSDPPACAERAPQ